MNKEEIKKLCEEEFTKNTIEYLDSALIFFYISTLEKYNAKYKEVLDKIKEKVKELDRFDPCGSMAVSMSISQFQEDLERLLEEIK